MGGGELCNQPGNGNPGAIAPFVLSTYTDRYTYIHKYYMIYSINRYINPEF